MSNKPYIKKVFSYSMVGSLGLTIVASLQGCAENQDANTNAGGGAGSISEAAGAEEGLFLVIRQTGANPETYELEEKHPSSTGTRAILKDMEGNERILSEEELKQMAEAEAQKVEAGTSNLTEPVAENQGLSLGETILASAAGALIGGMIANKLMGNSNFQQHQQQQNQRAQSSMNRSVNNPSGARPGSKSNSPKSGFFKGGSGSSSSSSPTRSSFGG